MRGIYFTKSKAVYITPKPIETKTVDNTYLPGQPKHHFKAEIGKNVSTSEARKKIAGAYKKKKRVMEYKETYI